MSDTDAAPPSPPSPSQSQHPPLWPRIAAPFTAHRVTAAFTVILALATLALVGTAYFQHRDAVEAIEATQRLAVATEMAAQDRRQTASAELILKIDTMLASHRYDRISDDIQSHDSKAEFAEAVRRGLADAGRAGRILRVAGADADYPVHPALPETAYLKTLTLALD